MKLVNSRNRAQASIEYILLIAIIATILLTGFKHIRDIFFGWKGEPGAIVMLLENNIISKLSTDDPTSGTGF